MDSIVGLGVEVRLTSQSSLVALSNQEGEAGASVKSLHLLEVRIFCVPKSVSHEANVYFAMLWKVALLLVSFLSGSIPRYDLICVCSIELETGFVLWLGWLSHLWATSVRKVSGSNRRNAWCLNVCASHRGSRQHTHTVKFFYFLTSAGRQPTLLNAQVSIW